MKLSDAKYLLSFHSSRNSDINNPLWENGFVRQLRPFKSAENIESAFHEIMLIIYTIAPELESNPLDKDIIDDLWAIVTLGKLWGNNKDYFSLEQIEIIDSFTSHISYTVFCILDGAGTETAFEMYLDDYPNQKSNIKI